MHILIVSDSPTVHSGYGGQVNRLGRRLVSAGHKVTCFGGGIRGPLQTVGFEGMRVFTHPTYGDVPAVRHLLQRLKADGEIPDVFLLFVDIRFVEYMLLIESELRKIAPVVLWHLWDNTPYPWFNEPFYDMCTRVICGTKFAYDLLKPMLGEKVRYVSLGVDAAEFRPIFNPQERDLLQGASVPESVRLTVGWMHRNIVRKRLPDILKAFQIFSQGKEKEVALLLHTSPSDPEGSDIKELRSRLVGKDRFFFLSPSMGQAPQYLNLLFDKMDVHVDIAWHEGFGMTVLESMAAGVPNIVVGSAELPHLVGDTGWILPPDVTYSVANKTYPPMETQLLLDVDIVGVSRLVDALNYAFENAGELRTKKEAARQRAIDCFSIDDTVRAMEKELEDAIGAAEKLPSHVCVKV